MLCVSRDWHSIHNYLAHTILTMVQQYIWLHLKPYKLTIVQQITDTDKSFSSGILCKNIGLNRKRRDFPEKHNF